MQAGAAALGAGGLQPPMPRPAVSPQARALSMYKPVIVLDPGHGGDDTGAQRNGTVEKNVVLAFSLMLRDKLTATGRYKVLMTRDTDVFIELNKRREFAERNLASLLWRCMPTTPRRRRVAPPSIPAQVVASSLRHIAKGETSDNILSDKGLAAAKPMDGDIGAIRGFLADLSGSRSEKPRSHQRVRQIGDRIHGREHQLKTTPTAPLLRGDQAPGFSIWSSSARHGGGRRALGVEAWRDGFRPIVTAIDNYFSHQRAPADVVATGPTRSSWLASSHAPRQQ
jgi:N-acetylmuramoyl-L-alanine amidase